MDLSTSFYLVAGAAVLITGLSKSGFGGGLGVMSVPLMSLYIPPQLAVAILMPVLLAMDVIVVWKYRMLWNGRVVGMLLPGAAVGLIAGGITFQWMSADVIRFAIGVLAVLFVAQFAVSRWRARPVTRSRPGTVFALGALSGFASFVAHAGGPPVKGILLRQDMEKSVFVGTNTMFFFVMNAVKTVAYGLMGQFTSDTLAVSLTLAPMLFLGIGLGLCLHHAIAPAVFTRLVYGFLLLAGIKLLFDSAGPIWRDLAVLPV
ncbi:sulfite exporter TauE/SafE family protein [Roseobacter sinensis]|uniref:Probable membrane transporter protein n=1 Tax=Roseobacter sinensis TaxID=2931391 RepID=A0ABT3BCN7_9RHOB|nr:sulfite exporter TauE/SafE family protein [Roseobacter sp. WL0113]MCV3271310.1 sulfite exporter TauE/SafE family protein [Roseobacter sp. WL0113]